MSKVKIIVFICAFTITAGGAVLNCGGSSGSGVVQDLNVNFNTDLNQGPNKLIAADPKDVIDLNKLMKAGPTGSLESVTNYDKARSKLGELVTIAGLVIKPQDKTAPGVTGILPADIILQTIVMGTLLGDVAINVNYCITDKQACEDEPSRFELVGKDSSCTDADVDVISVQESINAPGINTTSIDPSEPDTWCAKVNSCVVKPSAEGSVGISFGGVPSCLWGLPLRNNKAIRFGDIIVRGKLTDHDKSTPDTTDISVAGLSNDIAIGLSRLPNERFTGGTDSVIAATIQNYDTALNVCNTCNDGIDNDGDTDTDYPADSGCTDGADTIEAEICKDGIDNDGDTLADWSATPEGADGQPGVAGFDDDGVNGLDDAGELGWPGSDDWDQGCVDATDISEAEGLQSKTNIGDCPISLGANVQIDNINAAMVYALPWGINNALSTGSITMLIDRNGKSYGISLTSSHSFNFILSGDVTCTPCDNADCSIATFVGKSCCVIEVDNTGSGKWTVKNIIEGLPGACGTGLYGEDGKPGVADYDDDDLNGIDDAGELGWPGSDDTGYEFDGSSVPW